MKDLTKGSLVSHIATMAAQIFAGMIMGMLCQLVDLYFVSPLGDAAIAGVAAAGNAGFLMTALTQILAVGTVTLISHAVGAKNQRQATHVFHQALLLAVGSCLVSWIAGCLLAPAYMRTISADAAVVDAGTTYLIWFMPALALQFVVFVMTGALRGTGIARPTMIVHTGTVALNLVFAPLFIRVLHLGVAGAGLASSVSIAIGIVALSLYFRKEERYISFDLHQLYPHVATWKRLLVIGLPASGELAMVFVYIGVVFYAVAGFGASAQAGFGIGQRLMGLIHMPALSVAFAAGAIAGQNFGAGNAERVKDTFKGVALLNTAVMLAFTLLAQWKPDLPMRIFTQDAATIEVGATFLRLVSLNLVAQGLIFISSSMFQGLGNTKPVLISSGFRLLTYSLPVIWLSAWPEFRIEYIWYISNVTTTLQALLCMWLLRREFVQRLKPVTQAV